MQVRYQTDDEKWQAVEQRQVEANGAFLCAVKTTGIYCRPICAARPHRKNVEFFETADQAAQAGYRPCKRCKP